MVKEVEREIVLESGEVVTVTDPNVSLPTNLRFSTEVGTMICDLVREGLSYKEVADRCGIPASAIYRWKKNFEEFGEQLLQARRDGADIFAHKILQIANTEEIDKSEVPGLKLRTDLYRWLAERASPETYGAQTKITGDENSPLKIIVDTGIRRLEDSPEPEVLEVPKEE